MENQDIVVFKDATSVGIDKVPTGSIVLIKATGKMFQHNDTTGVTASTQIGAVNGTVIGGATIFSTNALFYGGYTGTSSNIATLLSPTAVSVQAEVTVGTARHGLAGASL